MFPTQNAENLPPHEINSSIHSQYQEEKSCAKEEIENVIHRKMHNFIKELDNKDNCFYRSVLQQWKNFLNCFIEIIDDSPSSNIYLKNKTLKSIFDFNKKIEIRNIDLHYILHSLKLVDKNKKYIFEKKLPAEAVLASILKSSLTYSKSTIKIGPTFYGDLEETLKECFHVSSEDLEVCDSIITKDSVFENCMEMEVYDYIKYSKYLCQPDNRKVTQEYSIKGIRFKRFENIIPNFTAQDMVYLELDKLFSNIFTKRCTEKEKLSFINDILASSKINDGFKDKNNYKFFLLMKFKKLDEVYEFKSIEINNARIYLERLMKIDELFKNEDALMMFISLLGISVSRNRELNIDEFQTNMAYFADIYNINAIKETSDNIIYTFGYQSRAALDVSYQEYLNYLKSNY